MLFYILLFVFFFFKQKTAYEMRISDWSSDVCSSDLTNEQAGLTFATGLKSILRQDPDVILVGEIRDVETARIATQSALTGHFVLSSQIGRASCRERVCQYV